MFRDPLTAGPSSLPPGDTNTVADSIIDVVAQFGVGIGLRRRRDASTPKVVNDIVDSLNRVLGHLNISFDRTRYLTRLKFGTADPFPGLRLE